MRVGAFRQPPSQRQPCRDRQIAEKHAAAAAAQAAERTADLAMEAARVAAQTDQEQREAARAVRTSKHKCIAVTRLLQGSTALID